MASKRPWAQLTVLMLVLPVLIVTLVTTTPLLPRAAADGQTGDATITDQDTDMDVRLYHGSDYFLTTDLSYGDGDEQRTTIGASGSKEFLLDIPGVYSQMRLQSIDAGNDEAARLQFYASSGFSPSTLDGELRVGSMVIASGSKQVNSLTSSSYTLILNWEGSREYYDMQVGDRFSLYLSTTGSDITFDYDSADNDAHLEMRFQSVREIEVSTEVLDLSTPDPSDRINTLNIAPHMLDDHARFFFWGSENDQNDKDEIFDGGVLDALGHTNLDEVRVKIYREGDESDPYFNSAATPLTEATTEGWVNYPLQVWDYSADADELDPGNHYRLEVEVSDIQGHVFNRSVTLTVDQYGVYLYLPDANPDREVGVGGSTQYKFMVRNTGGVTDTLTVKPSEIHPGWNISHDSRSTGSLAPGQEAQLTFTLTAPDDVDKVGDKEVIEFTVKSEGAPEVDPRTFMISSSTLIGAQYKVDLHFDHEGTPVKNREVQGLINQANDFNFTLTNLGQDADSFTVEAFFPSTNSDLGAWDSFIIVDDVAHENTAEVGPVARKGSTENEMELLVRVEPSPAGDTERGLLAIRATSLANGSARDTIYLNISRVASIDLRTPSPGSGDDSKTGPAGSELSFILNLQSFQEGEHTYELSHTADSGITGRYTDTGGTEQSVFDLEEGEIIALRFVAKLPTGLAYKEGDYLINLKVEDGENNDVEDFLTIRVNIEQEISFDLPRPTITGEQAGPGDTVYLRLKIKNTGNTKDNFIITLKNSPGGWSVSLSDSTVEVGPDQTMTVTLTVTVADDATNGEVKTIEVQVKSVSTDASKTQKFKVEVRADFTARMQQVFENYGFLLILLGLGIGMGLFAYYRSGYEEYDEDDTGEAGGDDFEDWE